MAVPKKKTSKSKKRSRRSHHHVPKPTVISCPDCGAPALPHRVCPSCGQYKGVKVLGAGDE